MADVAAQDVPQGDKYKNEGNKAMQAGELDLAIEMYSLGINVDEENHVLYSNRAAVYAKKGMWSESLADATKCVFLKPDWPKGYLRKGQALQQLQKYKEAQFCFQKGASLDPNDQQIKQGLMQCNLLVFQQQREEAEKKKKEEEEEKLNPKPEPPKPPAKPTIAELRLDLAEMPPKALKEILTKANIDFNDCFEKEDLINKIVKHGAYERPPPTPPAPAIVAPEKQTPSVPEGPTKSEEKPTTGDQPNSARKEDKKKGEKKPEKLAPPKKEPEPPKAEGTEEVKGSFDDEIDYYALLGVGAPISSAPMHRSLRIEKTATPAEIKKAYYKQAQLCHPDKTDDPKAEEQFKLVSEAYNVLMDEEKRKTYDKYGRKKVQEMASSGDGAEMMAMMLKMIFGGGSFDDTFGTLSMIEQMSPEFEQKFEGKTPEEADAIMQAESTQRIERLAKLLIEKLSKRENGGDKDFESLAADIADKCDAPGGPALLGLIGYIYISEGKKRMGRFLGVEGTLAGWAAGWNDTKAVFSLATSAVRAQQTAEDMEKGKQVDEEVAVGHLMDTMWKFGKFEILQIVRQVCSTAFKMEKGPKEVKFSKKKRAAALKQLGELYKAAAKKALKDKGFEKGTFFEGLAKETGEEAERDKENAAAAEHAGLD